MPADAARVVGRAAGGDDDGAHVPKRLVAYAQLLELDAAAAQARLQRSAHGPGLLHYLLEHEMLIAALFRGLDAPLYARDGRVYGPAGAVEDSYALRSQFCELAVFEKDGAARVRHERRDVGGKVVLTRA